MQWHSKCCSLALVTTQQRRPGAQAGAFIKILACNSMTACGTTKFESDRLRTQKFVQMRPSSHVLTYILTRRSSTEPLWSRSNRDTRGTCVAPVWQRHTALGSPTVHRRHPGPQTCPATYSPLPCTCSVPNTKRLQLTCDSRSLCRTQIVRIDLKQLSLASRATGRACCRALLHHSGKRHGAVTPARTV